MTQNWQTWKRTVQLQLDLYDHRNSTIDFSSAENKPCKHRSLKVQANHVILNNVKRLREIANLYY